MIIKKSFCLIGSCLCLLLYPCSGEEYTIGKDSVVITPPKWFVDLKSVSEKELSMFRDMTSSGNRLLAYFIDMEDGLRLLQGQTPVYDCHMMALVNRKLEEQCFTTNQFAMMKYILRQEQSSLLQKYKSRVDEAARKAGRGFSKHNNIDVSFQVDGVVPLGVIFEDSESIAITHIVKHTISDAESAKRGQGKIEQESSLVVNTCVLALLNGKGVYLYVFKNYEKDSDIRQTQFIAKEWVRRLLIENREMNHVLRKRKNSSEISFAITSLIEKQISFSTKKHPKANGLDVSIQYPVSWKAEEGIRPHVVQKFKGPMIDEIEPLCVVSIKKTPVLTRLFSVDVLLEPQELIPEGAVFLQGAKTKIDGEPGVWARYSYETERAGEKVAMLCLQYFTVYKGNMLIVQCSVTGRKQGLDDAFQSYEPVFKLIGNNIVINDKWK